MANNVACDTGINFTLYDLVESVFLIYVYREVV